MFAPQKVLVVELSLFALPNGPAVRLPNNVLTLPLDPLLWVTYSPLPDRDTTGFFAE